MFLILTLLALPPLNIVSQFVYNKVLLHFGLGDASFKH